MSSAGELVIFDLDGTLVDAFHDIQAALNHALLAHGLPPHDIETVRGFVGNGLSRLVRRAVPEERAALCPAVEAKLRAYYAAHPADFARLYPGVREALGELRAMGMRTAILSNKADSLVQAIADRLEFRPSFDAIRGELPGVPLKPNPEAIHQLMNGLKCARAVMVGDGLPDVEAAREAAVGFVGVAWGLKSAAELAAHGRVAESAADLPQLIRETLKAS